MSSSRQNARNARLAEIARVWNMLSPKPVELRRGKRRFLREGPIKQWSPKQKRVKKKYLFLFSDCLLVCRKDSSKKFWLKIFAPLKSIKSIQHVPGKGYSKVADTEFRLHASKKSLILFGSSKTETLTWIRDLEYAKAGCKGEAPSTVRVYADDYDEPKKSKKSSKHDDSSSDDLSKRISGLRVDPDADIATDQPVLVNVSDAAPSQVFDPFGLHSSTPVQQQPQYNTAGFFGGNAPLNPFTSGSTADWSVMSPQQQQQILAAQQQAAQQQAAQQQAQQQAAQQQAAQQQAQQQQIIDQSLVEQQKAQIQQQQQQATNASNVQPMYLPDAAHRAVAISQALVEFLGKMPSDMEATKELVESSQNAQTASQHLAQALNNFNQSPSSDTQRALQQAAANVAIQVSRLLSEAKFIAESDPPNQYKQNLSSAVNTTAQAMNNLVNAGHIALEHYTQSSSGTKQDQQQQQQTSKDVDSAPAAASSSNTSTALDQLENVLNEIALQIAASGEKLAKAAADQAAKVASNEASVDDTTFNIVKGTSGIAALTAQLIRVATEAQKEVVSSGNQSDSNAPKYHDDPAWREGLVSAAKDVGVNINLLIGATSEATTAEQKSIDMVIASLRQVNGANARLVSAARAKMSPDSALLPKLSGAVQQVSSASKDLEKEANQAVLAYEQKQVEGAQSNKRASTLEPQNSSVQQYMKRMETLAEVSKLERQLEEARKRVAQVTKETYDTT